MNRRLLTCCGTVFPEALGVRGCASCEGENRARRLTDAQEALATAVAATIADWLTYAGEMQPDKRLASCLKHEATNLRSGDWRKL